jgi:hypothetical protein
MTFARLQIFHSITGAIVVGLFCKLKWCKDNIASYRKFGTYFCTLTNICIPYVGNFPGICTAHEMLLYENARFRLKNYGEYP